MLSPTRYCQRLLRPMPLQARLSTHMFGVSVRYTGVLISAGGGICFRTLADRQNRLAVCVVVEPRAGGNRPIPHMIIAHPMSSNCQEQKNEKCQEDQSGVDQREGHQDTIHGLILFCVETRHGLVQRHNIRRRCKAFDISVLRVRGRKKHAKDKP